MSDFKCLLFFSFIFIFFIVFSLSLTLRRRGHFKLVAPILLRLFRAVLLAALLSALYTFEILCQAYFLLIWNTPRKRSRFHF